MTTHAVAGIGDPGIEILDREGRSARCETVDLRPFLDHAILGGRSVLAARLGRLGCGLRGRSRRGGRNSAVVQRAGRTISVKHFSRHAADHTVLLKLIVLLKIAHRLRRETAEITGDFIVIIAQIAQTHLQRDHVISGIPVLEHKIRIRIDGFGRFGQRNGGRRRFAVRSGFRRALRRRKRRLRISVLHKGRKPRRQAHASHRSTVKSAQIPSFQNAVTPINKFLHFYFTRESFFVKSDEEIYTTQQSFSA